MTFFPPSSVASTEEHDTMRLVTRQTGRERSSFEDGCTVGCQNHVFRRRLLAWFYQQPGSINVQVSKEYGVPVRVVLSPGAKLSAPT
jgi:hypothetical protein